MTREPKRQNAYPWRVSSSQKIVSRHRSLTAAVGASKRWTNKLGEPALIACNWCGRCPGQCTCYHPK